MRVTSKGFYSKHCCNMCRESINFVCNSHVCILGQSVTEYISLFKRLYEQFVFVLGV